MTRDMNIYRTFRRDKLRHKAEPRHGLVYMDTEAIIVKKRWVGKWLQVLRTIQGLNDKEKRRAEIELALYWKEHLDWV